MNTHGLLLVQQQHLAGLLEAIQRCVYFLHASDSGIAWPLTGDFLSDRKKDNDLFEALAAINERFAKLQDTMGAAMRHSLLLSGEQADSFIKVLALFEKNGVVQSLEDWQVARTARNLAAHDYETDYNAVAYHFNALHALQPSLYQTALRFVHYAQQELGAHPASADFASEFAAITTSLNTRKNSDNATK
ncbi:MAG TPA: hypothetical protein DCP03_03625 [Polaromonas sp.]|uniref:hypothetical protein n=1 Tax=Polaromonas sp. UBA4122 TaxID=1947074 RepID=UPI000ED10972|nr:hypothetical protein [Polaromonas sp. UBA4122]HAL37238.1 hypothetical protein [Polaromonas sp.]